MRTRTLLVLAWATTTLLGQHAVAPRWLATDHLRRFTPTRTLAEVGLAGTDLGVSFPCGDELVFLFGDSWTIDRRDWDVDSAANVELAPWQPNTLLTWFTRPGGRFLPLAPKATQLGGMDVPVEGLVVGDRTYVFFSSGWNRGRGRHSHSLLAHTQGVDFAALQVDHRVATDKFVNVSIVADGDWLWVFGTGAYRKSSVYLARVAAPELADRAAWRYWPEFAADEAGARPVVVSDCIGELSVRRLPGGEVLAMTCNASMPRGIHLRTASTPAGPWSDPVVVFDPNRDRGYGHHMHQAVSSVGYDDGLSEPGREEQWGGEYGPYLVPEWCTSPKPGVYALVYTLSTWNPYTVLLVRSHVAIGAADARADGDDDWSPPAPPPVAPAEPAALRNLDFAGGKLTGWQQQGDAFSTIERDDGSWFVCTFVQPRGDAVQGRIWQDFTVPADARELRGYVWGGDEAVQLWRGEELLRSTRGRRSNDTEVPFRWTLDAFVGEKLRLVVVDGSAAPWGFVSVRGLELVR